MPTTQPPEAAARLSELPSFSRVLTASRGPVGLSGARRSHFAAVETDGGALVLCDPSGHADLAGCMDLSARCRRAGWAVQDTVLVTTELLAALYEQESDQAGAVARADAGGDATDEELRIERVIQDAAGRGASDVHIVIERNRAVVRFRIRGQLVDYGEWSPQQALRFASTAYTTMAEGQDVAFNSGEMQDARIRRIVSGREYVLRYAHGPTMTGFHAVMRLLRVGSDAPVQSMRELGYLPEQAAMLEVMMARPSGVVIIAGTTGSGKSTTLANLLRAHIRDHGHEHAVLTIEDPPEYEVPGAVQCPVVRGRRERESKRNFFAETVRSAMRRDPDVILVGEIRDPETAAACVAAAQSGHKVLTTLHAASAFGIVDRLESLGRAAGTFNPVSRDVLSAPDFLAGLVYQVLLPVLCDHCALDLDAGQDTIGAGLMDRIARVADLTQDRLRLKGPGCGHCHGMGVSGMTVAAEVVMPDSKILEAIASGRNFEGYQHWLGQGGGGAGPSHGGIGVTALSAAIRKMRAGLVAPDAVEARCGLLTMQGVLADGVLSSSEVLEFGTGGRGARL